MRKSDVYERFAMRAKVLGMTVEELMEKVAETGEPLKKPSRLRIYLWGKTPYDIRTRPSQWRLENGKWVVKVTDKQAKKIASQLPPYHTGRIWPKAIIDGEEHPAVIDDKKPYGKSYLPMIGYYRQNGWIGAPPEWILD